jgi:hypothetical protein
MATYRITIVREVQQTASATVEASSQDEAVKKLRERPDPLVYEITDMRRRPAVTVEPA